MVMLLMMVAVGVQAGSSGSCGTKISCKAGAEAKCEMVNGNSEIFLQVSYLNLSSKTDLFLEDIYSYKIQNNGVVDCYYSFNSKSDDYVVFKTFPHHNVIPRDPAEWVVRYDTMYCDPSLHSCLLYILY